MSFEYLDAAAVAGRWIADEAIWHDGRCNWVGATAGTAGRYEALGPTLYKGTAGVGLFLGLLAGVTGDDTARRTALGALRHAIAATCGRSDMGGFHAGATGVAWAAVTVAEWLDTPELRVDELLSTTIDTSSDVMSGTAGTVAGLVALSSRLDHPGLLDRAITGGEDLIRGATRSDRGWSWPTPGRGGRRHLYGFAHGANGIAWSLLELHAATGDQRFLAAAEQGFAYERSWQQPGDGGWSPEPAHRSRLTPRGSWCHGEAGLVFSHLRAADRLGCDSHRQQAASARAATRSQLVVNCSHGLDDLSLCHGATGFAEAVGEGDGIVDQVSDVVLSHPPAAWPGGSAGGTTPSLFRGTSGIAWWLLRRHDPTLPSPLELTP
jgi:lantibiotic modifying enzyme